MIDYSQHHEYERWIKPFFAARGIEYAQAVEVGVHGSENSNTLNLVLQDGWAVLWIDASTRAISRCRDTIDEHNIGPSVQLQRGAVVLPPKTYLKTVPIYVYDTIGHDSLHPDWKGKDPKASEDAPTINLPQLLEGMKLEAFHFLSVDIEGDDEDIVLDMLTRSHLRPTAIMLEKKVGGIPHHFALQMHSFGYYLLFKNDVNEMWTREERR